MGPICTTEIIRTNARFSCSVISVLPVMHILYTKGMHHGSMLGSVRINAVGDARLYHDVTNCINMVNGGFVAAIWQGIHWAVLEQSC